MNPKADIALYTVLFQQGDERGFDYFFRQYYPALCYFAITRIGNHEVAEELASEAFVKTWAHHGKLASASGIRSYLYQVVRNACNDYLEKSRSIAGKESKFLTIAQPTTEPAPDEARVRAEMLQMIYQAAETLAPQCRKVFTALFIEGRSIAETAELLNISRDNVKAQKARGIALLRKKVVL